MEYGKAEGIRKKGLAGLITDNLVEGQGIGSSFGSAISDRTKATFTGIQEKFDPLNIAKKLTGGSNLAPALLGRLMGRKQSTIEHFAKPRKRPSARGVNFETGGALEEGGEATEVLGMIYEELKMAEETRKSLAKARKKEDDANEEREIQKNKAIIAALTVRKKKEEEDKKKRKKKEEVKEKPAAPTKPTPPGKGKGKGKAPVKEAPKPSAKEAPKPSAKETPKPPAKETPKPPAKPVEKPTAAPAPKPEVKPPTPAPAPKPEVKPPTAAPAPKVKPSTAKKLPGKEGVVAAGKGVIGVLTTALVSAGITNAYAQKAIIANVGKETGFEPRNEDLAAYGKTSNERIREVFTSRAQKYSDAELSEIKKDPYKFGEMVYGKNTAIGQSMGNTQEGDGFKYRGRGAIQLTGKNNYKAYSKVAGQDLVTNPELVNQPDIDYKIVAEFVKKGTGGKLDFQSQSEANRAVTQAIGGKKLNLDVGIGAKILQTVNEYSTALDNVSNAGSQIDQSSKENKDLKRTESDKNANIVNTTNVNQTNNTQQTNKKQKENDRPAILEKSKG
jgi:predicted chitinase